MTLTLTLVRAPHPQPVQQMRLSEGELVIGRGVEADWRIDDPDMYVSRAHCTVVGRDGGFAVTDTSSGGLYVDEAAQPLGAGRTTPLVDGMRLRLGDYVVQVAIRPETALSAAVPTDAPAPEVDDFFSAPVEPAPRPERPAGLPEHFDRGSVFVSGEEPEREPPRPVEFDDPFTLEPSSRPRSEPPAAIDDFGWPTEPPPVERAPAAAPVTPVAPPPPEAGSLLAAFLRGAGIDPADLAGSDPAARMEAYGREYRLMAEGLMQLLRMRAEEKGSARIAQTVVGGVEVNPLKFMPTVDDALGVMAAPRGRGFASPEAAIAGAVQDLAAHHVGTWRGTQTALRRMIDRFDPAMIEKELEALGLLETLLAGGRRAKLWELYQKRFAEIARSAECRFLGEVGADFRDAYEREED